MVKNEDEHRKEVKELLNKAFEIKDCEEGHTEEVKLKDSQSIVELISILQSNYGIGIDTDKEGNFFYALNEDIDEDKEEA